MHPKASKQVRIILLKEVPQIKNIYEKQHSRDYLLTEEDNHRYSRSNKVNHTSIAYLSSILQDEHSNDRTTIPLDSLDEPSSRSIDKIQHFRASSKKSNRYLSCLLEGPQIEPQSNTSVIDKLFQRRKIMPIDKLKQRKKNITFSLKNKRELNQDFNDFVTKQIASTHPLEPYKEEEKETIIFSKRKEIDKKYMGLRGQAQRQKGRRIMKDLQAIDCNLEQPVLSNKKLNVQTKEPGYAIAFKRLSSDIPRMNRFQWSRLDDNSYQLIKG